MSKFVDRMKHVFSNASPPMGFRKHSIAEESSQILLLGQLANEGTKQIKDLAATGIDAIVIKGKPELSIFMKQVKSAANIPVGIKLENEIPKNLGKYVSSGLDFIIFGTSSGILSIKKENLGTILQIDNTMTPAKIKAINNLDMIVDCVLLENKELSISIELLLTCHLFSEILHKPLLTQVNSKLTGEELMALSQSGIKGLLISTAMPVEDIKELRMAIANLPKSISHKAMARPLIPGISSISETKTEIVEGDEDEDEEV